MFYKFIIPLFLLLAVAILLVITSVYSDILWVYVKKINDIAKDYYHHYPIIVSSVFVLIYSSFIVLFLPVSTLLCLSAGWLFGIYYGTFLCVIGSTLASMIAYYIIRYIPYHASDMLQYYKNKMMHHKKWAILSLPHHWHKQMLCILSLRFIPFIPFVLVNIACALLKMRFWVFVLGTMIGIIPMNFALNHAGATLHYIWQSPQPIGLWVLLDEQFMMMMVLLAVIMLLFLWFKRHH